MGELDDRIDEAIPPIAESSVPAPKRRRALKLTLAGAAGAVVAISLYSLTRPTMPTIQVGDQAPDFTATTHDGRRIRLADYLGKQVVVLYFYPKDNTQVCTAQACAFRDAYEDFTKAGAEVIGVSGDDEKSHQGFAAKQRLPFLLVSDSDGAIRKAFGVPKTLAILPGRVTYVIDKEGVVRHVFNSQFNADRHVTESLATVRELSK